MRSYLRENEHDLLASYPGLTLRRLLQTYCEYNRVQADDLMLADAKAMKFFDDLQAFRPLEYILKRSHFYNSSFYVNENVLIPRNETEILVEDALNYIKNNPVRSLADIGVGSGCILFSILCEANCEIDGHGIDISEQALEVCRVNAFRHRYRMHPKSRYELSLGDRLQSIERKFDLIVSNPPYIDFKQDAKHVHFQTYEWEPHEALFLENRLYEKWFDEFFLQAFDRLESSGAMFMEGHESKLEALEKIAKKYFAKVRVKNDYTGVPRFLHMYKS